MEFEAIVVNDSGQPSPGMGWRQSIRVSVIIVFYRERIFARNTGAAEVWIAGPGE